MKFILVLCLLYSCELRAQLKDSAARKYFVCESLNSKGNSKIIKEGERILVSDTSGKKLRGVLTIFNDTFFEVHNLFTGIKDTFNIKSLNKVKKPSFLGTIISSYILTTGVFGIVGGAYMIYSSTGLLDLFLGTVILTGGAQSIPIGLIAMNGKRFYHSKYKFRIIKTKGFELKKEHIKSL